MANKKRLKIWLIAGACVLAVGGLLLYLSNIFWVNPVASEVIKNLLQSSSKKYIIEYEALKLNTLNNEINISNIRIAYDSSQLAQDDSTRIFLNLEMDRLNLAVQSVAEIAYDNSLTITHAILESPRIKLYRDPDKKKEKNYENILQAYQFISEYLQSLNIQSFSINNATFQTFNLKNNDTIPTFELDSISASFSYLSLDSAAIYSKNFVENIEDFNIDVKHYKRVLPDSLYSIEVDNVKINKQPSTLVLEGLKLLPMYEKYEFAQRRGYQNGMITLKVPSLTFRDIDFKRLADERAFVSQNLLADSLSLDIFSDKHMDEWERYRLMIPEMLKSIPFTFRIDTLQVKNGTLKYDERPEGSEETGGVVFGDLFATLYNTTNIVNDGEEVVMEADVQTLFMNEGKLKVNFRFPLHRADLHHTIKASLTAMPLTKLNGILEAAVNTKVESGQLDKLEFTMELDQEKASGMMHFAYHDLKIELLGKDDDPNLLEKLGSFLANFLVLKTDNPSGGQSLREGPIYFEREKEKAVFGYWVKSLLSGVKVSVGVGKVPKRLSGQDTQKPTKPQAE